MKGIDYAWAAPGRPDDGVLDARGVRFVARYASAVDPSKQVGALEAARHHAAGRAIVLVYEDAAGAMLGGRPAGVTHARALDAAARAAGLPGIPGYAACDFDASEGQQGKIHAYLDGWASVLGPGRTGLYGGYWPLSRARAAGKARYLWGTVAWSGSNWETCGWKPHIMQGAGVSIGGVSCDWDESHAAGFGQWDPAGARTVVLARGSTGAAVAELQKALGAKLAADGVLGPVTEDAVRAFQVLSRIAVDGVCGPATWAALDGRAPPAGGGQWHGEYVTAGMLPLAQVAAKLGWPVNTLLRMTAVHYGTFGNDLGGWLAAALADDDRPVPEGVRLWCD